MHVVRETDAVVDGERARTALASLSLETLTLISSP